MRPVHLAPAGVVLLALAALGGIAQLGHPAASASPAATAATAATATRQVAVTSAVRACPPALGGGSGTVALIASPTGSTNTTSTTNTASGQAELTSLPPAGLQLRPATPLVAKGPGALSLLTVPAAAGATKKDPSAPTGWSVTATGPMAPAMEAEVAENSGLATVRCGEPSSDLWFVGPGQQKGLLPGGNRRQREGVIAIEDGRRPRLGAGLQGRRAQLLGKFDGLVAADSGARTALVQP